MKRIFCWLGGMVILMSLTGCFGMWVPKAERGIMGVMRKAFNEMEKGNIDKAIKQLEGYQKTHPHIPDFNLEWFISGLADCYEKKEDFKRATELLEGVIEKQPYFEGVYFQLARLYLKQGLEDKLSALLEKRRILNLVNLDLEIGQVYEGAKRFDKAIEIYKKAIQEIPSYFQGYIQLGNAYRKVGSFNKAIHSYERALEYKPENFEALLWIGGLYAISGKGDKAKDSFEKTLNLYPGTWFLDYKNIQMVKQVISFLNSPAYSQYLQDEFAIKYMGGDMNLAIEACKEMVNKEPKILKWHFYLGMVYSLKEENKEAKEELKKVITIAPYSIEAKLSNAIMEVIPQAELW
ncbi:MAG: tetratricopeptide repeat protein [bacterium]